MRVPKQLQPGDTIGLVTPSSPAGKDRTIECKRFLEQMGYQVVIGKSCLHKLHGYLAGDRFERANDINEMFANPNIHAILCIRGGYGSGEVMDLLDYEMIKKHPKVFVGYSDVTNLLMAFNTQCDFITYHGPMVSSNMLEHFDEDTKSSFFQTLSMTSNMIYKNPKESPLQVIAKGCASGTLIGGNLAVFMNSIGTFYAPDFKEKILFIEDVYESVPRVHRMLEQLRLMGALDEVNGILIGDFSDADNPGDPTYQINNLMQDFFCKLNKPVIANLVCGHCYPTATLPMGARCNLDTNNKIIQFYA